MATAADAAKAACAATFGKIGTWRYPGVLLKRATGLLDAAPPANIDNVIK
ncbi:MAG: hypothetical protein LBU07_02920 [Coriobacteriales bacterium]|jgi:hypothetical protein|nr:hypothetical protein [Coriobacteriales bacterium]